MGSHIKKEDRGLSQKGALLGFWVLAVLGMMIFLLSGCGSDSTPKDAASGKKEKAAKSGATVKAVTPLLIPQGSGTAPTVRQFDKIPGSWTEEEIEAKRVEAARAWEKLDPKEIVLSGFTKEQLEARLDAERAKKPNPKQEIVPGLTMEQIDAKLKAHRERPLTEEIFPGFTLEQMKAKAAQERQLQQTKSTRPEQVFPK
jgi:hypothetical protein